MPKQRLQKHERDFLALARQMGLDLVSLDKGRGGHPTFRFRRPDGAEAVFRISSSPSVPAPEHERRVLRRFAEDTRP